MGKYLVRRVQCISLKSTIGPVLYQQGEAKPQGPVDGCYPYTVVIMLHTGSEYKPLAD